jgi:hypothetical protein
MMQSNRKFFIAYVLLVGLPILGLVGILKSGRAMAAPISVDGTWALQTDPAGFTSLPCGKSLTASDLVISQSGGHFTLTLKDAPKATASGALTGTTLKASLLPSSPNDMDCGRGHELVLFATVDPKATPNSLTGTISLNDCPACTPIEFRALRRPPVVQGVH